MEIRILGPLEVVADDQVVPIGPPQQEAVLAVLALSPGEVVSTDRIVSLIWGDARGKVIITV